MFVPDPVGHEIINEPVTKIKSVKRKKRKGAVSQGEEIKNKQRPLDILRKQYESPLYFNTEEQLRDYEEQRHQPGMGLKDRFASL